MGSVDMAHAKYGEMMGLTPDFIKRADPAWYSSHHHDAAGKNVDYAYSYLFGYPSTFRPVRRPLSYQATRTFAYWRYCGA